MTEVDLMYDLRSGADINAYHVWAKKAIEIILKSSGLVEFRASRNVLGSPFIRSTTVWKSLSDWSNFVEGEAWEKMRSELMEKCVDHIQVKIWGPSPVVPKPLKP